MQKCRKKESLGIGKTRIREEAKKLKELKEEEGAN